MHTLAMILALSTIGANDFTVTTLGSGGGVPQTLEIDTQLHLGDGVPLSFGGTSGDPDVWMDDNGTTWCFTTTDFDGGGTDSDLLCYTLGSNALTLGITSIDSTAASLDLDLVDNDPSALSINASGLAGMLVFDTTNSAEKISTGATLELGATLDANGQLISDSTGAVKHGTDGTPGHVGPGDDYFGGDVEVDGSIWADDAIISKNLGRFDGSQLFRATSGFVLTLLNTVQNPAAPLFGVGSANHIILIAEYEDQATNFGVPNQTDPTVVIQSSDATDTGQRSAIDWNRIALGGDGGGYGCINQTFAYDDLTDGGGASGTLDLDEGIPDGAVVQQAVLHSLTGFTGDTSAVITIGDGTDVDRYNTGTPSVFTTNASGVALGVPSGTVWHDNAATVTVTVTSATDYTSVSAGQATILVCYFTP